MNRHADGNQRKTEVDLCRGIIIVFVYWPHASLQAPLPSPLALCVCVCVVQVMEVIVWFIAVLVGVVGRWQEPGLLW